MHHVWDQETETAPPVLLVSNYRMEDASPAVLLVCVDFPDFILLIYLV